MRDFIKDQERESSQEIIDIIFAVTGYGQSGTPGGESFVVASIISTLIKYIEQRANEVTLKTKSPDLENHLLNLTSMTIKLYGEYTSAQSEAKTDIKTATTMIMEQKKAG